MSNPLTRGIPLSQLAVGASSLVENLGLEGLLRRRIIDLGILPGSAITCLRRSPAGDPTAYEIRGTVIALRQEDAGRISVIPIFGNEA